MASGLEYESVLCVKPQVHVYRIPPRPSNRGYRASDWKLDQPDWTGRLRVVAKGGELNIKLEDKTSGELFAKCPIEQYPGIAVEAVTDSSRYFVLRIKDDGGRAAFIGIGFEDRGDSFDLNVALQDHFKHLKQEKEAEKSTKELQSGPKLDLGFKEGQTIRINIATKKSDSENSTKRPKPRGGGGGGIGFLPPPPGSGGILPPPAGSRNSPVGGSSTNNPTTKQAPPQNVQVGSTSLGGSSGVDLLLDLGGAGTLSNTNTTQQQSSSQPKSAPGFDMNFDLLSSTNSTPASNQAPAKPIDSHDPWGDFASASTVDHKDTDWIQF